MTPSPRELVLATGNAGKQRELEALLTGLDVTVRLQSAFGLSSAEETGQTFVENAILKARHAARETGLPALADDSGLEVDALAGAPGVYSARYAGPEASDTDNVEKLLAALAETPDEARGAAFRCVVVLLRHADDPAPIIREGRWAGRIARQPTGSGGFGYDPVFFVPEYAVTAAELEAATKNAVSHRAQALTALRPALESWCSGAG
ncbi:MAG: RdgB/HAM1 family non-canonical purine NTP pyrophosphatase [Pseudomonadota bacterium]